MVHSQLTCVGGDELAWQELVEGMEVGERGTFARHESRHEINEKMKSLYHF